MATFSYNKSWQDWEKPETSGLPMFFDSLHRIGNMSYKSEYLYRKDQKESQYSVSGASNPVQGVDLDPLIE